MYHPRHRLTYEQQLTEELHILTEMLGVLTAQHLEDVPKARELFRYLSQRKTKCEDAIKAFKWEPKC